MRQQLSSSAIRDSDLPETTKMTENDYVAVVQNGVNKKFNWFTIVNSVNESISRSEAAVDDAVERTNEAINNANDAADRANEAAEAAEHMVDIHRGPKGDKGDDGADGPQGPKGDKGDIGYIAFEIEDNDLFLMKADDVPVDFEIENKDLVVII